MTPDIVSKETEIDFKSIPKVELHAHLNGSLSISTIKKLHSMGNSKEKLFDAPLTLDSPKTMEEVFRIFPIIQSVTTSYEAVKMATMDVIRDFNEDGTVYLELRTTPKDTTELSKKEYVDAVLDGIRSSSQLRIVVRLLLSIDRRNTVDYALDTVNLAIYDESSLIVGIDLSGDPSIDGRGFIPVLQKARRAGLRIAVHLAEVSSNLEEVDEFLTLGPDRIGHGTFLHTQPRWVEKMFELGTPLEVCLTSNALCRTTPTFADSHFSFWRKRGLPIAISTDDQGLMGTSLSNEYRIAASTFNLSRGDLASVARDALDASFLNKESQEYRLIERLFLEQRVAGVQAD